MDGRVPERIRARALRAFGKQTVLANIDGLMSIATITDAATVIENLQQFTRSVEAMQSRLSMR